jgi:predicted nucleic acid-binding protein
VTSVIDASIVLAGLVDSGESGAWARDQLSAGSLVAPHLLPAEVVNGLRRLVARRVLSADSAALATQDLEALAITFYPFAPFVDRVWELRGAVTSYDAWYVALAEAVDAPLATLDVRLVGASGPRCRWITPADR